jgi:hypothetical protein
MVSWLPVNPPVVGFQFTIPRPCNFPPGCSDPPGCDGRAKGSDPNETAQETNRPPEMLVETLRELRLCTERR